jgi:hypothetical protein
VTLAALLGAFLFVVASCQPHVFSPPAGIPHSESSATLGDTRYRVRAEAAWGDGYAGPELSSYRASVVRGFGDQLDVSLAPSVVVLHPPEPGSSRGDFYSARMGVKYAPLPYAAVTAGLAPGGSAGGGYLSPDLGLTLAAENPYFVPFVSGHGFLSAPFAKRTVRVVWRDDGGERRDSQGVLLQSSQPASREAALLTPHFTYGTQLSAGIKLPLRHRQDVQTLPAVTCAAGITLLFDRSDGDLYANLGCSVEITLQSRWRHSR